MSLLSRRIRTGGRAFGLLVSVVTTGGCYAYRPLGSTATPGTIVSASLTDAGRVTVGRTIGEGARKLEGLVETVDDTAYVLRMRSVTYLNGQTNGWTGERLSVSRQAVTDLRERRFSSKRTAIAVASSLGGVIAFIVTRSLLGGGSESTPGGEPGQGSGS
jgi:hypothetical protein